MKVLTAAQMREVDRRTIDAGIPGIVLMENAGCRVVDFLVEAFPRLSEERIVIFCGKGNNGGDGLVIARQLFTRFHPRSMKVVLTDLPAEDADAGKNLRMLLASGIPLSDSWKDGESDATIVIDALLGTGLRGPAEGHPLDVIRQINTLFPLAKIVSVDLPSGMPGDTGARAGEYVRADYTVTFTAPKISHIMPPNCDAVGELRVCAIGSPPGLYEDDPAIFLNLTEPRQFRRLLGGRARRAHKGDFGHVLVVGGTRGKSGAASMAGIAALRAGAGLVTVCSDDPPGYPELMTQPLGDDVAAIAKGRDVIAIGPGLGTEPKTARLVTEAFAACAQPMVLDADALNVMPKSLPAAGALRVFTPHPGEMARLTGRSVAEILSDRLGVARSFAMERGVALVLKGQRTLIAYPNGQVWVNPTGTPAMATGGSGDILTGLIAGLIAQHPGDAEDAILAAVWLHGRAGELGAAELGEECLIATDLLHYLPGAMKL